MLSLTRRIHFRVTVGSLSITEERARGEEAKVICWELLKRNLSLNKRKRPLWAKATLKETKEW
jgi:hypothetical protein